MKNTVKILSQKVTKNYKTDKELKYPKYLAYVEILRDGTMQQCWINLNFKKDVEGYKKLEYGFIEVESDGVDCPEKYEIRKNVVGKDGQARDKYPTCWISKDVLSYEPVERPKREKKPATQNRFPASTKTVDEEIEEQF